MFIKDLGNLIKNTKIDNIKQKLSDAKLIMYIFIIFLSFMIFVSGMFFSFISFIIFFIILSLSIFFTIKENLYFFTIGIIVILFIYLYISFMILFDLSIGLSPTFSGVNIFLELLFTLFFSPFIYYTLIGEIILLQRKLLK